MANLRYLNQPNPIWDFINSFDDSGSSHPPWFQQFGQHDPRRGPPGPPESQQPPPPPPPPAYDLPHRGPSLPPGPPPPPGPSHDLRTPETSDDEQARHACHGKRHGSHGHGRESHVPGGHGRHRGGFGGGWRGRGGPAGFGMGGPWNMNSIADLVGAFVPREGGEASNGQEDFKPAVDVFDTKSAYVVHVSLAGAKKEDTGVSWDPATSQLSITGVIHRPGDEEFLKTLALDERKVGAFERKVKLGSRAKPALVEMEGMTAKMEDGVLCIHVPKEENDDFVEVKKVDIQ